MLIINVYGLSNTFNGSHFYDKTVSCIHSISRPSYSFNIRAWYPYLKIERYWNSIKYFGMLF